MRTLAGLNEGKRYCDQIKPFNFLLTCHVKAFAHPIGTEPERFHLIAPYESDPRKWLTMKWIDQYTGKQYRITTAGDCGTRHTAVVKTYGDVLREYEFHPESKCADATGNACRKQTVGLLQRRHIAIDGIISGTSVRSRTCWKMLEDVEFGMIHSAQDAYTEYCDPQRDEWQTKIVPALRRIPLLRLVNETGLSRRMVGLLHSE